MIMDEELKNRFLQQMLHDLLTDNTSPFPTILCEMVDPKITESVRRYCLFAQTMIPFRVNHNLDPLPKRLDSTSGKTDFGMLYIDVNIN